MTLFSFGQNQDSHWIFGDMAWLDFSSGAPINQGLGPFFINEGGSSIANQNGDLLFTTDGEHVYDRNGSLMPSSGNIKGHSSSTQCALIVPMPGDPYDQFFYIFTVSAEAGNYTPMHTGLEYIMVDMSLNMGLGDIVGPSTQLVPNTGEKLHATWHANKRDVWVLTHSMDSDEYHAFLITCDGITTHQISTTGLVHSNTPFGEGCIGSLKLSPDGSKVASSYNELAPNGFNFINHLEVGEFNTSTGAVTMTQDIIKDFNAPSHGYGIEFSPDNSKVYWTISNNGATLFQYDLSNPPLMATEYVVSSTNATGLQLAPDGKIYAAGFLGTSDIAVINNPDVAGVACGFVSQGITITGKCRFGLPNQWMFPYPTPEYNLDTLDLVACPNGTFELSAPQSMSGELIWSNNESNQTISVHDTGLYWVTPRFCDEDTTFFNVEMDEFCICELFVPNSFTPNGDGINDEFRANSWCDLKDYQLQVFDRWGQLVFESRNQSEAWNGLVRGKGATSDIYVWRAVWTDPHLSGPNSKHVEIGHVSLLR